MRTARKGIISEKLYVLGRREREEKGILNVGRYYAIDKSLGSNVYIDGVKPHVILICGKRGYGKSYTMGTFIEEIASLEEEVRKKIGVVVIDTLGIFWTTFYENKKEANLLKKWGYEARGFPIKVFSSQGNVEEYKKRKIDADMLLIKTSELSPSHWCQLFSVSLTEPVGVAIASAINCLKEEKEEYEIDEILDYIKDIRKIKEDVKGAAENFFQMAKSWNIFDKKGLPISKIVQGGKTTILDISSFSEDLKILSVTLIARKIFEERVKERKRYEEKLMEGKESKEEIPLTWMAIDEAHVFLPMEECPSKDVLIKQWMRQGRQPGVSLILATQRPSTLDPEVLSHSDIIICHRLTAQEDIDALNKVRPTYMQGEIKEAIKKVGTEKGVALIIDDTSEAVHIIKIRPRLSWHGGEEPSALG